MNDTLEKTSSSSLAVVEKKPQRPGGCVGIFFQLFDWNRRFAKKKLFSKKLIPPVRLKQSSKKFGGDEKQRKLRLIADENSGGFLITKNNVGIEQHQEMRAPGLVARLMGLDSMPALHRDKSKKVPATSNDTIRKSDKFVDNVNEKESNVEKGGGIKHELRPQKLQKTSISERRPITKFVPEKSPAFKSVLSRSRKHHHQKLPSPVKSPRNISRKNSSKLIGAATKILEPSSRSKSALTYTNTLHRHPSQNGIMDDSSCRNCGYRIDNLDSKSVVTEKQLNFASPLADCVGPSCHGPEISKSRNSVFYQTDLHKDYGGHSLSRVKFTSYKSHSSGQIPRNSSNQYSKPPKAPPLSLRSNKETQSQFQMLQARGKDVNGTNNFDSVNQSLNTSTRPLLPARMENGKFEQEQKIFNSLNDSVPLGRKRRPANASRQGEGAGFTSSTANKRNFGSEKQLGYNAHFVNSRNGTLDPQERKVEDGRVENSVVSFTFNPAVKRKSGIHEAVEGGERNVLRCDESLPKLAFGGNGGRAKLEKPLPLSGDALGAVLQQKLKELNYEGDDIGETASRKTTSMILQELICALTSEKLIQQDNLPALSDRRNIWCNYSKLPNSTSSISSQVNAMAMNLSIEQPLDGERPSPGSVLETYFSTESCYSSSRDDTIGCKMLNESTDCSYSRPRTRNELLDSAVSNNRAKNNSKELVVINILNHVSEILNCNIFANCGPKGIKLDQSRKALLNAELILHSGAALVGKVCPIKHLLLHELETLVSVLWMNFGNSLGIEDGNQLKEFVLDSTIEYLDERFGRYPKAGSNVPLGVNTNTLIFEIVEAVRRWDGLSRCNNLDELIEREMRFSSQDWRECESEGFETWSEISRNVVEILVDEIVMDLWS